MLPAAVVVVVEVVVVVVVVMPMDWTMGSKRKAGQGRAMQCKAMQTR